MRVSDYKMNTMDMLQMIKKKLEEREELMNKRFEEMDKKWEKLLRKPETNKVKENSDDTSKRSNEVSEEVSESKIVEVVALENKILNINDNYEIIVGVECGEETDQLNENKDDQVTYNTVSRGEKNDGIIKKVVLENKVVNTENADKVLVEVECNNGMLMSVDELERKCRESLEVEGLNFPGIYCEPRCSLLLLKGKSPLLLEDMRSSSCSLKFCDDLVPFAWDSGKSVRWPYGERYFEREWYLDGEIELFKVGRNYKELVERLDVERAGNYIEYLLGVESDISTVVYDNVTYLSLTEDTKGEFNGTINDK